MPSQSRHKRVRPRYPSRGEFEGSELPLLYGRRKSTIFRGRVKDISDGGFCLLADRAPRQSVLLQGQLKLANVPVQIPTIVQVCCVAAPSDGQQYRIGVRYMI